MTAIAWAILIFSLAQDWREASKSGNPYVHGERNFAASLIFIGLCVMVAMTIKACLSG
jgi:hypothetical protein